MARIRIRKKKMGMNAQKKDIASKTNLMEQDNYVSQNSKESSGIMTRIMSSVFGRAAVPIMLLAGLTFTGGVTGCKNHYEQRDEHKVKALRIVDMNKIGRLENTALRSNKWKKRNSSVGDLSKILNNTEDPPGQVVKFLEKIASKDNNWHVRMSAVVALGKLNNFPHYIVKTLGKVALNDLNRDVRASAVRVLNHVLLNLKYPPEHAIKALEKVAKKDRDEHVQISAIEALSNLKYPSKRVVRVLKEIALASDENVRYAVCNALGDIAYVNYNRDVQKDAIQALDGILNKLKNPPKSVIGTLESIVSYTSSWEVMVSAVTTLVDLKKPPESTIALFEFMTRSVFHNIGNLGVQALGEILNKLKNPPPEHVINTLKVVAETYIYPDVRNEAKDILIDLSDAKIISHDKRKEIKQFLKTCTYRPTTPVRLY